MTWIPHPSNPLQRISVWPEEEPCTLESLPKGVLAVAYGHRRYSFPWQEASQATLRLLDTIAQEGPDDLSGDDLEHIEWALDLPDGSADRFRDGSLDASRLYMYDHGSLAFSLGPFACPWDSGILGHIVHEADADLEAVADWLEYCGRSCNGEEAVLHIEEYDYGTGSWIDVDCVRVFLGDGYPSAGLEAEDLARAMEGYHA